MRGPLVGSRTIRRSCTVLAALLAAGCVSYSARPFDSRREASAIIEQREADGLYVAVEDLSTPRSSLQYFDRDLASHGYAPVLLLLELDRSSENVFDVRRDEITLCLQDGTRLRAVDPLDVADDVSFSHARSVFGFLLIFPGFFVASSVNRANEQMVTDYQLKSVKSVRINPNMRSFRSVLFFQIPEEVADRFTMEDAFIEVKVFKQGQGGSLGRAIEFPVHFGK
jgi:hypothetical protein